MIVREVWDQNMIKSRTASLVLLMGLTVAVTLFSTNAAEAYVGPGLGLGAIAVVIGVIGSILLAIFAIIWYPVKRTLKKRRLVENSSQDKTHPDKAEK